jgi:hypothetical protein
LNERSVYCGKNDDHWEFHSAGEPLPEEETTAYTDRRKQDRLNEQKMLDLLAKLGARPWEDNFYRMGEAFRIERIEYPETIIGKKFPEFACKRQ